MNGLGTIIGFGFCVGVLTTGYFAINEITAYFDDEQEREFVSLEDDPSWRARALERGAQALAVNTATNLPGEQADFDSLVLDSTDAAKIYSRETAAELRNDLGHWVRDLPTFSFMSDPDVGLAAVSEKQDFVATRPEISQDNQLASAVLKIRIDEIFEGLKTAATVEAARYKKNITLGIVLLLAVGITIISTAAWKNLFWDMN